MRKTILKNKLYDSTSLMALQRETTTTQLNLSLIHIETTQKHQKIIKIK